MEFSHVIEVWSSRLFDFWEQQSSVAIGVFSMAGEALYTNQGFRQLVGESLHNKPTARFLTPSFSDLRFSTPGKEVLHEGLFSLGDGVNNALTFSGRAFRKDRMILVMLERNVEELERVTGDVSALNSEVVNLQRDLMKEKRNLEHTLEQLRETQAMLIQSEKMSALGQLVAGVAHEINNPIAFVNSNLHSMKKEFMEVASAYNDLEEVVADEGSEQLQEEASEIRKEFNLDFVLGDIQELLASSQEGLNRVKKIVEDLRSFSRLDEANLQTSDLIANLTSTISLAQPEIKKKQVTVTTELPSILQVQCYPAELNQVFLNLLINGIQAVEDAETRTIIIRGRDEDDHVVIEFEDNGVGMTDEIKAKIFNPFFTTKPVGTGTGLGLSVVYKIITEQHGGAIDVVSAPGKGTTFVLSIPKEIENE